MLICDIICPIFLETAIFGKCQLNILHHWKNNNLRYCKMLCNCEGVVNVYLFVCVFPASNKPVIGNRVSYFLCPVYTNRV